MNKIIIGIIVFIIIFILFFLFFFYLKNSCSKGNFFSTSDFKCMKCKSCPTNLLGIKTKWYNPEESCKGFKDRKCLEYSMPECKFGETTRKGTATTDIKCIPISDNYVDCDEGEYTSGKINSWNARGKKAVCRICNECSEDEVDIKDEMCIGRDNSNIPDYHSRIFNGEWIPMSCEGTADRICLPKSYIKYNETNEYNIILYSQDESFKNYLSTIPDETKHDSRYYQDSKPENIIYHINQQYRWGKVSILNFNKMAEDKTYEDKLNSTKWNIKSSNLSNTYYNNCPIEQNDIIYFYKKFDNQHDLILCVIESNGIYNIGNIKVYRDHHNFPNITTYNTNILKNFKIENLKSFNYNILVSNDDTENKYFNLQLINNDSTDTNMYLGSKYFENPKYITTRLYNKNDNKDNFLKISFKKI